MIVLFEHFNIEITEKVYFRISDSKSYYKEILFIIELLLSGKCMPRKCDLYYEKCLAICISLLIFHIEQNIAYM